MAHSVETSTHHDKHSEAGLFIVEYSISRHRTPIMTTRPSMTLIMACALLVAIVTVLPRVAEAHHRGHYPRGPFFHFGPYFGPPGFVLPFPTYPRYYPPPVVMVPGTVLPPPAVVVPAPVRPNTHVYVYPAQGQSPEQLSRDRYECHVWAVKQSQFDPSAAVPAPSSAVGSSYIAPPPTALPADPLSGAAGGAALGALGGAIAGDAGTGAAVGAAVGAMVGLANESERVAGENAARAEQHAAAQSAAATRNHYASRAREYRRAVTACLTGRGYSVR
jgi:hypothetical protein